MTFPAKSTYDRMPKLVCCSITVVVRTNERPHRCCNIYFGTTLVSPKLPKLAFCAALDIRALVQPGRKVPGRPPLSPSLPGPSLSHKWVWRCPTTSWSAEPTGISQIAPLQSWRAWRAAAQLPLLFKSTPLLNCKRGSWTTCFQLHHVSLPLWS